MKETRDVALWGVRLPQWNDDSPSRLFELFQKHQSGTTTPSQRNEYSQHLMGAVAIFFKQKRYDRTLHEVRLEPSDVAQDVLLFLTRKTVNGNFRLEKPCPLTFLQAIYTSTYRYVCSAVSEARRRNREVASTDYYSGDSEEKGGLEDHHRSADSAGAVAIIRDPEEAEMAVIGDIVTSNAKEAEAVQLIWLYLSDSFCNEGRIPTYHDMPASLRRRKDVSLELHAAIASKFNRYIRDTIDSL